MRGDQAVLDTQFTAIQEITDTALLNPEVFRRDARAALKKYTPQERSLMKQLSAAFSPMLFFDKWEDELKETRMLLHDNKSNKNFLNSLQKYLLIGQKQSPHIADTLVRQQDATLVSQFIDSFELPDNRIGKKVEQTIARILKYSDQHIESLKNHYVQSTVYSTIASRHAIHISDPHQSLINRIAAHQDIANDRNHSRQNERKALRSIEKEVELLLQKPLIANILGTHIEAVEFFGARAAFDKKLAGLSEKEAANITTRAALMAKESAALKEVYRKRQSDITSENIVQHDAFFDELIRQIFSLSTVQKNFLMRDIKKYRSLITQKNEILATQAERHNVLNETV